MTKQHSSGGESVKAESPATVQLSVPTPNPELFRHKATSDVLRLLLDSPSEPFTIRQLSRLTEHSPYSIKRAVDVLDDNDLVTTRMEGNRRPVQINPRRVSEPDDPVLRIPQPEFHEPVRAALDRLRDEFDDIRGVLVFGSVAHGSADRRSDIDLWVLVEESNGNQHRANEIAKQLGEERFDGERYEFQILVETVESAHGYADRLEEVFTNAITLHDSETLRELKQEILNDA